MSRTGALALGICLLTSIMGCSMPKRPVTEGTVDNTLIVQPSPTPAPTEEFEDNPRAGFEQESPKAQSP